MNNKIIIYTISVILVILSIILIKTFPRIKSSILCLYKNDKIQDVNKNVLENSEKIIMDEDYKKELLKTSGIQCPIQNTYSIIGPEELKEFVLANDSNPKIYTPKKKEFRANLHMHTIASDGEMTPEELLSKAVKYANKKNETVYVAITDHNTMESAKKAFEIVCSNPEKYKNIKVLLGIEVFSQYFCEDTKTPVEIHILGWCINPYDEELNKIFYKKDPNDRLNYSKRSPEEVFDLLTRKGYVGIAHPARYVEADNLNCPYSTYYENLFSKYKQHNSKKLCFTEAYYQSYSTKEEKSLIKMLDEMAHDMGIIRTGSTDSHHHSIFSM